MKLFEIIKNILKQEFTLADIPDINKASLNEYISLTYRNSLNEMAKINVKEFYGLFPYNKFDIRIWSNDHNPPHFHVIADGWDIVINIKSGEILRVKQPGKNSKVYTYVKNNIQEWLNSECVVNSKLTNRENAQLIWLQINPD